jgi:type VI secretion system secreted protein Hcp
MRYTLKNVIISSISIGGGGGDRPVETLTLNYTKINWTYAPQQGEGAEGRWNLSTNRPD